MPTPPPSATLLQLLRHLHAGHLRVEDVRPFLEEQLPTEKPSLSHLHDQLASDTSPAACELRKLVFQRLISAARRCHAQARIGQLAADACYRLGLPVDLPLGWRDDFQLEKALDQLQAGDASFFLEFPVRWYPVDGPGQEAMELERLKAAFLTADTRSLQEGYLDQLLAWPSQLVAPILVEVCREEWAQRRCMLGIVLRFGRWECDQWGATECFLNSQHRIWTRWLSGMTARYGELQEELAWARAREAGQNLPFPKLLPPQKPRRLPPPLPTPEERAIAAPALGVPVSQTAPEIVPETAPPSAPTPAPAATPRPEPRPSLWATHIQPILHENWYLVVGVIMVIVGASLLAYYTWDKHWLMRYTVMPTLILGLTVGFAEIGSRLRQRFAELDGTALMMRGAAIGLLPINIMAVALLSGDPEVAAANKRWALPLMIGIYLLVFGWGLRRWCPTRGMALILLALNAIIPLGVSAQLFAAGPDSLRLILCCLPYLGFFAAAQLLRRTEGEGPSWWFVCGALSLSFLQVLGWSHWSLRISPSSEHYAILVILAGGLFAEIAHRRNAYSSRSFIGFTLVILGTLMSMSHSQLRIGALLLAGAVWLYQASYRQSRTHHWIGLTLLGLGAASVSLLDGFTHRLIAALGITIAAGIGLLARVARRSVQPMLHRAAGEFQLLVLFLTAIICVLAQWHFRSAPIITGAGLIIIAGFFVCRAQSAKRRGWMHAAMAFAALALPYLGCVDMIGRSLHGNTLIFGLGAISLLWLAAVHYNGSQLLRDARSTVLLSYGALAVSAMIVRVFLERGRPGESQGLFVAFDMSGPFLMALALGLTAWCSRSLVPGLMAAAILAILFPELKRDLQDSYPMFAWGSGVGSAISATLLCLGAIPIARHPKLTSLTAGDRFNGSTAFPLVRRDSRLFTIPMLAAAIFLAAKVCVWTLPRNLIAGQIPEFTGIALALVALSWLLLSRVFDRPILPHLCWITTLAANIVLVGYQPGEPFLHWPLALLSTCLIVQALSAIVKPFKEVLHYGSWVLAAIVAFAMFASVPRTVTWLLAAFVAFKLVPQRHALPQTLLLLLSLSALTSAFSGLTPVLLFAIAIFSLRPDLRHACYKPWHIGAIILTTYLSGLAFVDFFVGGNVFWDSQRLLLVAVLCLAALSTRCAAFLLTVVLLGYLRLHMHGIAEFAHLGDSLLYLAEPFAACWLVLVLAAIGYALRWGREWFYVPAIALAALITTHHGLSDYRHAPIQLWAPYVCALSVGIVAYTWRHIGVVALGAAILIIANQHSSVIFLENLSLSQHLAVGFALSLLQLLPWRRIDALAIVILALIGLDYLPFEIANLTTKQLLIGIALALIAACGLRKAHREWAFGVAVGSLALILPDLRTPQFALYALAFLPAYFYFRGAREAAIGSAVALIVFANFAPAYEQLFFPAGAISHLHYHEHALLTIVLGLFICRQHRAASYVVILGAFFLITWLPTLSPFTHPLRAAWVGIAYAHVLILLKRPHAALGGSLFLTLLGLYANTDTYLVAPLVAAWATVCLHYGQRALAAAIAVAVLHLDFVLPSYLDADYVLAVLLGIWALMALLPRRYNGATCLVLLSICLPHLVWHGPNTTAGLAGAATIGLLFALTPRQSEVPCALDLSLALLPSWLVYFSLVPGIEGVADLPPLLGLLSTLMVLAAYAGRCGLRIPPEQPRTWHYCRAMIAQTRAELQRWLLGITFCGLSALAVIHHSSLYSGLELLVFSALWCWAGFELLRQKLYVFAHAAVVILTLVLRRQLMLQHPGVWTPEYDVWAGLAISMLLTAAKARIDRGPEELRQPFVLSLLSLPVIVISWVVWRDLGTDIGLVVLLIYSAMFAFLGRHAGNSPYNVVAVSGFVAFVIVLFANKLELRVLHAYIIPTGLGVLALVQLFRRDISAEFATQVRTVTLLLMLGSTGWYAIMDPSYPMAFHMTMLLLSLAAMGAGSLMRIRVFLLGGATGVIVDLFSIMYKIIIRLDRPVQMTAIGLLILLLGIALVAGTAYYKTQRNLLDARLNRLRTALGSWE